jgi:hypothetical protein
MGVDGQCHASATLPLGKRFSTLCTGGWVGAIAIQDGSRKYHPLRASVAILSCL